MSYGEPEDVDDECNARLFVGDNFGDNHATFRCSLAPQHVGPHCEVHNSREAGVVTVTWEKDERSRCNHCGQWEHDHDDKTCPRYADDHDFDTCELCQNG